MTAKPSMLVFLGVLLSTCALGCEAKVGERCDGFFKNQCAYPGVCVTTDDGDYCAVSCKTHMTGDQMGQKYCEDPSHEIVQVTAKMGSMSAAMGCHCVPK